MDWGASPPASVLIVNDDGLPCSKWCPFLSTFIAVLSQQGGIRRVFVCVPSRQQSWVSKRVERFGDIGARVLESPPAAFPESSDPPGADIQWATVDGSPATAVLIAAGHLCPFRPDLVISGPNFGQNCGTSYMLSSGTVGGAMEAAMLGLRSVAASIAYAEVHADWSTQLGDIQVSCQALMATIAKVWRSWPDGIPQLAFNIGVKLGSSADAQAKLCTALSESYGPLYRRIDSTTYSFDRCLFSTDAEEGTDRWAINNGFVAVTPIQPRFAEPT
ncbi:unnamed protein product (mitochondrion) [Plasmodiophora brassicae]|nr:unnamed protein product [Plasmodiophora brassicae]